MITVQIEDKELLAKLASVEQDSMTIFTIAEGRFRGAFVTGTKLVNQMRANHNLGILETMVALFISPSYSDLIVFVTFIVILVVRQMIILRRK